MSFRASPRKEFAPLWHIGTELLLKRQSQKTLTETVDNYPAYLPTYFVLPHPSPRNRFWLTKNPWFEREVLPVLKNRILEIIS